MTRVIGLTGGIGTGKSTVARMLAELGAVVIDSDAIVHELQAPGTPLLAEIEAAFGPDVLRPDGSLDRAALGARVFADPAARARLNALVHPAVGRESLRRLEAARASGAELVVVDIPLLFETRVHGTASRANLGAEVVVVVYAPRELQIERQLARNGYDRAEAERRLDAQLPIEEKRRLADHVIDNAGSLERTREQVRALYERLVGRAPAGEARAR
jgi:dephospho-CoA kinase